MGGTVQTANETRSVQNPGRTNSRRRRRISARMTTTETSSSAFVYLQRNPRPTRNPLSGHHHENAGLRSSASQKVNIAAVQKKMLSGSVVITNEPMLKIGTML